MWRRNRRGTCSLRDFAVKMSLRAKTRRRGWVLRTFPILDITRRIRGHAFEPDLPLAPTHFLLMEVGSVLFPPKKSAARRQFALELGPRRLI